MIQATFDSRTSAAGSPSTFNTRIASSAAVLTVILTAATAVAGVATPARSGPFCGPTTWTCTPAPYTDVAKYIPGDYIWLIPGILLAPVFVVLMAAVHAYAAQSRKMLSLIALACAIAYAVVIGVDYFFQFAVVVPSLQAGETEALSLFTQYNPHGLFIAGEAFGYLSMSLALAFAALVFEGGRIEGAIRRLFIGGFVLGLAAFVWLWVVGGDLIAFEVSVLSIDWVLLIAGGVLMTVAFRRGVDRPAAPHSGRMSLELADR